MTCITPMAPTGLRTAWLSWDSWYPWAAISTQSTSYLSPYFWKYWTSARNFLRSDSEAASFTYFAFLK